MIFSEPPTHAEESNVPHRVLVYSLVVHAVAKISAAPRQLVRVMYGITYTAQLWASSAVTRPGDVEIIQIMREF